MFHERENGVSHHVRSISREDAKQKLVNYNLAPFAALREEFSRKLKKSGVRFHWLDKMYNIVIYTRNARNNFRVG